MDNYVNTACSDPSKPETRRFEISFKQDSHEYYSYPAIGVATRRNYWSKKSATTQYTVKI